jgi:hypothetical protein
MVAVGIALALLLGGALVVRDRCAAWTAGVLFTDWCVCAATYYLTAETYNPGIYFAVDYTAAWVLFMMSQNRSQLAVVLLFALAIISHASRMVMEPTDWIEYNGYWFLFYVTCIQATICAGGILSGGLKSMFGRRDAVGSALAGEPLSNGMAEDGGRAR